MNSLAAELIVEDDFEWPTYELAQRYLRNWIDGKMKGQKIPLLTMIPALMVIAANQPKSTNELADNFRALKQVLEEES